MAKKKTSRADIQENFLKFIQGSEKDQVLLSELLAKMFIHFNMGEVYFGCQLDQFEEGDDLGLAVLKQISNGQKPIAIGRLFLITAFDEEFYLVRNETTKEFQAKRYESRDEAVNRFADELKFEDPDDFYNIESNLTADEFIKQLPAVKELSADEVVEYFDNYEIETNLPASAKE